MRTTQPVRCFVLVLTAALLAAASAAPPVPPDQTADPQKMEQAARRAEAIDVPEGMRAEVFAAELLVANPVAFCFGDRGQVYVAETFRVHAGVEDNPRNMYWFLEDLSATTLADRRAKYRRHAAKLGGMSWFTEHADRIRLVRDTDGDGQADRASRFAGPYNDALDGVTAGVIARRGNVWVTSIPHLYRYRDRNGDGEPEEQQKLLTGFGIRDSYLGHDLHGLAWGPDGRLYFTVGDRGYNVTTPGGRTVRDPIDVGRGAVFRCEPDGTDLEVVYRGLRNPQELAFDDHGNLFTVDNNSDAGDKSRLVYCIEGGDSGWIMGYQYMDRVSEAYPRGPWNAEKLWHPHFDGQAAWITPPVAWITAGPSGLAHYPGLGLRDRYDGHFFVADFRGSASNSGVRSFAVRPDGAGFEMTDAHKFAWGVLPTDVAFGYDGGFYIADWIEGWNGTGKGRLYRLTDPKHDGKMAAAHVGELFRTGFTDRSTKKLLTLLRHADQRVRLRAQFALAERGPEAIDAFSSVAQDASEGRLARLHAVWGLGQITRAGEGRAAEELTPLLDGGDAEVRAQAAKVLGEAGATLAADQLVEQLEDPAARARCFAAIALGKVGGPDAVEPLIALLRRNDGADPYMRHAAVSGLVGTASAKTLAGYAAHDSVAVRRGVVVALRRMHSPRIARFLDDPGQRVVTEAARAIYDVPIPQAMPELAALLPRFIETDKSRGAPLLRRAINANLRVGGGGRAEALVRFAAAAGKATAMRREALAVCQAWSDPSPQDRVIGAYRPVEAGAAGAMRDALAEHMGRLLNTGDGSIRARAIELAKQYSVRGIGDELTRLVGDGSGPTASRVEALRYVAARSGKQRDRALRTALSADAPQLRMAARKLIAERDPKRAAGLLKKAVEAGTLAERQQAFRLLGGMDTPASANLLNRWMRRLVQGRVERAVQLDLIEAAEQRGGAELKQKLRAYRASLPEEDPLAPYRPTLRGGRREAGREVFFNHNGAQCQRCHAIDGEGGEAGPELTGIGDRVDRAHLLESLIRPGARIADGFALTTLTLRDGTAVAGTLRDRGGGQVTVVTPAGEKRTVDRERIASRTKSRASSMPPMGGVLTKRQIRDLIAFLSSL